MLVLRRVLLGVLGLVLVLLVVAYFLPRHPHVERSIAIAAPPATVFELVNGFERFAEFSPWHELDPDAEYTLRGPRSGVGARMEWASEDPSVGSGSQEIIASEPVRQVKTALDFGGQGTAVATWTIEPAPEGSKVTWAFDADLGMDPLARYAGLTFERFIGNDYENGLQRLKALAERQAHAAAAADAPAPAVGADPAQAATSAASADSAPADEP